MTSFLPPGWRFAVTSDGCFCLRVSGVVDGERVTHASSIAIAEEFADVIGAATIRLAFLAWRAVESPEPWALARSAPPIDETEAPPRRGESR
jgi:hypothetical protein